MIKTIASLAILACITGCSFSANASHAIGPTKVVKGTATSPTQIAMYGDSTTVGITYETGVLTISPYNLPLQLGRMLNATGYNVVVTNYGEQGTFSYNLLNGTGGFARPWADEMAQSTAPVVFINEGMNDSTLIPIGKETNAMYQANISQLISVALSYGKIVLVEGPNPRNDTDEYIQQISQDELAAVQAANNPNVYFIGHNHQITSGDFPNWPSHLPDGIHPDDMMYSFKAALDYDIVIQALGQP